MSIEPRCPGQFEPKIPNQKAKQRSRLKQQKNKKPKPNVPNRRCHKSESGTRTYNFRLGVPWGSWGPLRLLWGSFGVPWGPSGSFGKFWRFLVLFLCSFRVMWGSVRVLCESLEIVGSPSGSVWVLWESLGCPLGSFGASWVRGDALRHQNAISAM